MQSILVQISYHQYCLAIKSNTLMSTFIQHSRLTSSSKTKFRNWNRHFAGYYFLRWSRWWQCPYYLIYYTYICTYGVMAGWLSWQCESLNRAVKRLEEGFIYMQMLRWFYKPTLRAILDRDAASVILLTYSIHYHLTPWTTNTYL